VEDNKMIAGMVIIGVTLITLAYIGSDSIAPTAPEEPEKYYYNTEEYKIEPIIDNGIMVLDIDTLTFEEAFKIIRAWKGPDDTFFWHGVSYTTKLESEIPLNWIEVGDDIDDQFYCPDNYVDECGVCGGVGLRTWYIDNDGDGLGDSTTIVRSCSTPL
jgi:hypothetical protein